MNTLQKNQLIEYLEEEVDNNPKTSGESITWQVNRTGFDSYKIKVFEKMYEREEGKGTDSVCFMSQLAVYITEIETEDVFINWIGTVKDKYFIHEIE